MTPVTKPTFTVKVPFIMPSVGGFNTSKVSVFKVSFIIFSVTVFSVMSGSFEVSEVSLYPSEVTTDIKLLSPLSAPAFTPSRLIKTSVLFLGYILPTVPESSPLNLSKPIHPMSSFGIIFPDRRVVIL